MGVIGGLWDTCTNAVKGATAPLVGVCKMAATSLETGGKVLGDCLNGNGSQAIDDIGAGFKQQVNNAISIPETQISAFKGEVCGLGDTLGSSVKLVGEPVRGVLRIGASNLQTSGAVAGQALNGNFSNAGDEYINGGVRDIDIAKETATNQVHNLFW